MRENAMAKVLLILSLTVVGSCARLKTKEQREGVSSSSNSFVVPLNIYPITNAPTYQLEGLIELSVGTPPQTVSLIFDTGSWFPVIFNTSCTSSDCGQGQAKYDSAASSSSYVDFDAPSLLEYGAGNMSGFWTLDNFSFPNAFIPTTGSSSSSPSSGAAASALNWVDNFTAVNNVSYVHSGSGSFTTIKPLAGILGLGPYSALIPNTTSRVLAHTFGIEMVTVRMPRGQPFVRGEVQFGGYDLLNPEFQQPLWVKNDPDGPPFYFVLPVVDILLDGVSTGVCTSTGTRSTNCGAFMDTGGGVLEFSYVNVPQNYSSQNFSCTRINSFPSIGVVFSGMLGEDDSEKMEGELVNRTFTLQPEDYIFQRLDGSCQSALYTSGVGSLPKAKRFGRSRRNPFLGDLNHFKPVGKENQEGMRPPQGMMDFGILWSSRVTTIFDWKHGRVGLMEHN